MLGMLGPLFQLKGGGGSAVVDMLVHAYWMQFLQSMWTTASNGPCVANHASSQLIANERSIN